jgi:hypothetical protein
MQIIAKIGQSSRQDDPTNFRSALRRHSSSWPPELNVNLAYPPTTIKLRWREAFCEPFLPPAKAAQLSCLTLRLGGVA